MSLIQLLETGRSLAERIPYSLVALVARLAVKPSPSHSASSLCSALFALSGRKIADCLV